MGFFDRLTDGISHGWNVFSNKSATNTESYSRGGWTSYRPDRTTLSYGNDRTIINSIYNRIAVDASSVSFEHAKADDDGLFRDVVKSGIHNILTVEANIDQSSSAFIQDLFLTMLDEGHAAIVPVETSLNPNTSGSYDILDARIGKITDWFEDSVRVEIFNQKTQQIESVVAKKSNVAIIENPFYNIMNERNSTLQRLNRRLALLDIADEKVNSPKLDIIVQLPYVIKGELRKKQAQERRDDIVDQLNNSTYGIAYADGTEKIIQLNRPAENTLMAQIEYLTNLLFSQLGITADILNGTADEKQMLNYYSRTINPLLNALIDELNRKFLTKTARTQGHVIRFYRPPFELATSADIAELADKFTRNEILSSNEMRVTIGFRPSSDPEADKLKNSNLNHPVPEKETEEEVLEKKEPKE